MAEATKRGTESVSLGRLPVSALLRGAAAFPFPLHAPESSLLSLLPSLLLLASAAAALALDGVAAGFG